MENDQRDPDFYENGYVKRQQRLSLHLTLLMLAFLLAGAANGIWMTWKHDRDIKENKKLFDEQNVMIADLHRNLRKAIKDVEENRKILESRTPKFEAMEREAERNRNLIENMLKDRERPDSPWKSSTAK